MSKRKLYIPGPVHKVEIRLVSKAYINRLLADPGEVVSGGYIAEENLIYLDKSLTREELKHTLVHEVSHMLDHQMRGYDIEKRADCYATWAINFYEPTDLVAHWLKL